MESLVSKHKYHRYFANYLIPGEIKSSFLKYSARYSNICALLADNEDVQTTMDKLIKTMDSIKKEDLCGFDLACLFDPSQPHFIKDFGQPIFFTSSCSWRATVSVLSTGSLTGEWRDIYSPSGDVAWSLVCALQLAEFPGQLYRVLSAVWQAEKVMCRHHQTILFQPHQDHQNQEIEQVLVLVEKYIPIAEKGIHDLYLQYGFAAGYLCDAAPVYTCIISVHDIRSHFISTLIPDTNYRHVLPINKVSIAHSLTHMMCSH